jgi:hydrogenase 3 maturation protease
MPDETNPFQKILKGKILLFGIGNTLRGDDALGPLMVERLKGAADAVCINGENAPEKFVGKIIRENPDTLLIIDAVHLDLEPGHYEILNSQQLESTGFSTHDISLKMLIDYMKTEIQSKIYILGVQPSTLHFSQALSPAVEQAVRKLVRLISESCPKINAG